MEINSTNLSFNKLCTIVKSGIIHNLSNFEGGITQKNQAIQKHHDVDDGFFFTQRKRGRWDGTIMI